MVLFPGPFRLPLQTASNSFPPATPLLLNSGASLFYSHSCASSPTLASLFSETASYRLNLAPSFFDSAAASLSSLCSFATVPSATAVQHLPISVSRYTHAASI
ncbi:hypothetical protein XELAEV_18042245mg [Xenopus laevis]|uniref:Uncharacterized protein n=1 Tax=Xenopus laevis TaxID=8355 RepID=A0A974C4G1_XENLA|nr:hypothetical protein XELAEV_18042245mg [Xenopus laevis]